MVSRQGWKELLESNRMLVRLNGLVECTFVVF